MSDAAIVYPGVAAPAGTPVTPHNIPHRGGPENPSASALAAQFKDAIKRVDVVWGETTVVVDLSRVQIGRAHV